MIIVDKENLSLRSRAIIVNKTPDRSCIVGLVDGSVELWETSIAGYSILLSYLIYYFRFLSYPFP